eukprot:gnl/MRDRNA2_/MRDRNA2_85576_c2_seq5.p1 gnl/MRDRNA2_/MRDRNA2_85576_c2~~gnl/MRDRNA2_/MRDRNA2_85576_c2_seq5.p1  ORF type:complete len:479 (+),score=101.01 gnl/MRDRNA2_/MRDRNA2_85576_c2_seq5:65-1501(+)
MLPTGYAPTEKIQTGNIHDLSFEEVRALQEIKDRLGEKVKHPRFTDVFIIRWLRCNHWDVDAAADMLSKHLDFREQVGLNDITDGSKFSLGPPELTLPKTTLIKQLYPHCYHGTAKDGTVLYIERIGLMDPSIFDELSVDDFLQYFAYQTERMSQVILPAASLASGKLIERATSIIDLEGVSIWTVRKCVSALQALSKLQQANFPETMGRMIVINAPSIASWVFGIISILLDTETQSRIQLIDCWNTSRKDELLSELIAAEDIPAFLGGQCHCYEGCQHSHKGPWSDAKIKRILDSVPYWDILTRVVAGEHLELMAAYQDSKGMEDRAVMAEYQRGTSIELAGDACSGQILLHPASSLKEIPGALEDTDSSFREMPIPVANASKETRDPSEIMADSMIDHPTSTICNQDRCMIESVDDAMELFEESGFTGKEQPVTGSAAFFDQALWSLLPHNGRDAKSFPPEDADLAILDRSFSTSE